jgi:hypothetical protein
MIWTFPAARVANQGRESGDMEMPGGIQMGFESSMIYTMGMALNRALDSNADVSVLVDGQWLSGSVVIYDGYGVVLEGTDEHSIVKVDLITAVRILSRVPGRAGITEGAHAGEWDEAMPMPGPRMAQSA